MIKSYTENLIITKLGENLNTQFADFAPHFVGNFLYYSTMRFESMAERKRMDGNPQKKLIYMAFQR
jgi:hypothetical protein